MNCHHCRVRSHGPASLSITTFTQSIDWWWVVIAEGDRLSGRLCLPAMCSGGGHSVWAGFLPVTCLPCAPANPVLSLRPIRRTDTWCNHRMWHFHGWQTHARHTWGMPIWPCGWIHVAFHVNVRKMALAYWNVWWSKNIEAIIKQNHLLPKIAYTREIHLFSKKIVLSSHLHP